MVGVPLISPISFFIVRPLGSFPDDTLQVYGDAPPSAFRAELYGAFTETAVSILPVIVVCVIFTVQAFVAATLFLSTALTVNVNFPAFVGEPVIFPVVSLSFKPSGNSPLLIDHVYGFAPLEAVSVPAYVLLRVAVDGIVPDIVVCVTFTV